MPLADNQVARVTMRMTIDGKAVQSVKHVRNNGAGTVDDATALTEIATRCDSAYTQVFNHLPTSLLFQDIVIHNVTTNVPMGLIGWPVLVAGSDIGTRLANQLAINVLFGTLVTKSQGRTYLGPYTVTHNTSGGVPTAAAVAAAVTFGTTLIAPWLVATGFFEWGAWNDVKVRFAPYETVTVKTFWRNQRRRMSDVGS